MIHYIKGSLVHVDLDYAVIECNGIGYRIATSSTSIDAISLVGFSSPEELKMFQLLTSVSGVGTKVGIAILSSLPYTKVANAIHEKDLKTLTSAQGVGKKTAERMLLELKDKVAVFSTKTGHLESPDLDTSLEAQNDDALLALVSLGYTRNEAQAVLSKLDVSSMRTEDILKMALKALMTQ